jgi:hypothetical protein
MRRYVVVGLLTLALGVTVEVPRVPAARRALPIITFLGWEYVTHDVIPCDRTPTLLTWWPDITVYITAIPRVTAEIEQDVVFTSAEGETYHSLTSVGVAPGQSLYSVFGENQVVGTYEWILWENGIYTLTVAFGGSSASCTIKVAHAGGSQGSPSEVP